MRRKCTFCEKGKDAAILNTTLQLLNARASCAKLASVQPAHLVFCSCFTPVGSYNGICHQNIHREQLCCDVGTTHWHLFKRILGGRLTNSRAALLLRCRNWRQWPDTPARWTRLCSPTSPSSCWPSACSSPPGSSCILQHNDWCWFALKRSEPVIQMGCKSVS